MFRIQFKKEYDEHGGLCKRPISVRTKFDSLVVHQLQRNLGGCPQETIIGRVGCVEDRP
jgi:hypothetical protein